MSTAERKAIDRALARHADVLEKTRRARAEMTPEEDAAITADALNDPDNPPIDDDAEFMSLDEARARLLGRTQVALELDVVERFRRAGDDWQERIDALLREAAPAE